MTGLRFVVFFDILNKCQALHVFHGMPTLPCDFTSLYMYAVVISLYAVR